jgi:hypothetical protein
MTKKLTDLLLSTKSDDNYELLLALEKELRGPSVSPSGELIPEPVEEESKLNHK